MTVAQLAVVGLVLCVTAFTVLWVLSLALRNASIVDVFWGPGFAVLAVLYASQGAGEGPRELLVAGLTVVWALRLALHIFSRNRGQPEDYRYAKWRESAAEAFWWKSYFSVFLLQALLMWLISAPLLAIGAWGDPSPLTVLDGVAAALWAVGFAFESVGDAQLRRFRRDPANRGRVLSTGLWAYTRHPNYFGDALVWWGYFLFALSVPRGAWTLFSPILMTLLLLKVSGVSLLERGLRETKPEYAEYASRTSAFFPLPPRRTSRHQRPK